MTSEITAHSDRMRMPDGTLLFVRELRQGDVRRQVLILPHLGESIMDPAHERIARSIMEEGMLVRLVELRAHKLSEGHWSLGAFRRDLTQLIAQCASSGVPLYVVAWGLCASTMLEYDDQAHTFRGMFPPLPSGMLLLDPLFSGKDILPRSRLHRAARAVSPALSRAVLSRLLRAPGGYGFGACRLRREDLSRFWRELSAYEFVPVRAQTPSWALVPIDEHADPLKRIFGSVRVKRVDWLHHLRAGKLSSAQAAQHLAELRSAFSAVLESEPPIRFRVERP
jgi:hypothetical protein